MTSAAYAAPGSPIPALVHRTTHRLHSGSHAPAEKPLEIAPIASPSGIAVQPGDFLSIQFSSLQTRGRMMVAFRDQPGVVVRAMDGAPAFTADPDRLPIGHTRPPRTLSPLL